MSPTGRTLKLLRSWGYTCEVCERWVPRLNIRRDLLHCADVIAFKPGEPILLVQVTSAANVATRLTKAKGRPELSVWLKCDGTAIKTAARSNPTLYLIKGGTILRKWSYADFKNAIPAVNELPTQND